MPRVVVVGAGISGLSLAYRLRDAADVVVLESANAAGGCVRTERRDGGPESVAAFARRRAGREAAAVFADALVTGIHGGDPELLDVRAAFPRLTKFEAESGSVVRGMMRAARAKRAAGGTPQR